MREYEIINQEVGQIIAYEENGVRYSFPAIETNSKYQEYLRYTEWVEAGNNPEDFWTQTEEGEG